MIIGGDPISVHDAYNHGLINRIVPKENLLDEAIKLGQKISANSTIASSFAKRSIKQSLELSESSAVDHERSLFISIMGTHDKKEGVNAFLEKRKANFENK